MSRIRWRLASLVALSATSSSGGDWAQWRGPDRSGHATVGERAPAKLPKELKAVWKIEIGGGFSSPVVGTGKLAYLDAQEGREMAHLIDAQTGKEIWRTPYAEMYEDEWGPGPRSTPILDGDRVYAQSCKGEFRCLNLADGKVVWGTSFAKDFGVKFVGSKANEGTASRRGNNGTGVIDGDRLFLPVGSTSGASLVCFDKTTGKVLWNSQDDEAAYSSLMVATLAGVRQVIYFSADALMGLDVASGKLLWRVSLRTEAKRHACTPVIYGDSVMVSSHTFGLACFKIVKDGAGLKAAESWRDQEVKINVSTPVLVDHWLFSQGPKRDFVCVDTDTGRVAWSQPGFSENYGSVIALADKLLIMTDRGELVVAAARSDKYTELGRMQVCGKTWNHPAYADGKLYVREGLTSGWKLSCFELGNSEETPNRHD